MPIYNDKGDVVWNSEEYFFIKDDCPETANPSLWRQSQLLVKQGLFEVVEGIYQVRGFDISNITFVHSTNGCIVIDPLISKQCAPAALKLFAANFPDFSEVVAVIYTHSHADHYGVIEGMLPEDA